MFLSDELILIGIDANPKSNMEMGRQSIIMLDLLGKNKDIPHKKLINVTKCAIRELNKLGYDYYNFELFF